jgi:hypothetical protein
LTKKMSSCDPDSDPDPEMIYRDVLSKCLNTPDAECRAMFEALAFRLYLIRTATTTDRFSAIADSIFEMCVKRALIGQCDMISSDPDVVKMESWTSLCITSIEAWLFVINLFTCSLAKRECVE